jgi:hypothetical protein
MPTKDENNDGEWLWCGTQRTIRNKTEIKTIGSCHGIGNRKTISCSLPTG